MSALFITPAFVEALEDRSSAFPVLPGPHTLGFSKVDAVMDFAQATQGGHNVEFLRRLAVRLHGDSGCNIVVPVIAFPQRDQPLFVCDLYVIAHPADAMRIAREHVRKSVLYGQSFLGQGVLTTRDLDSWRMQRAHLVTGFLPSVLKEGVFPVSMARARYGVLERLPVLARGGTVPVNLTDFYLHEAMAQLHIALLGEETDFSETHNTQLRASFAALLEGPTSHSKEQMVKDYKYVRQFSTDVLMHACEGYRNSVIAGGCPVVGPVGHLLSTNPAPQAVRLDTVSTVSFAGFDTTANLMQWFTLMMCLHPDHLQRVVVEVDSLFARPDGAPFTFESVAALPFLTRCIVETLRLFPSVPNGTFRELDSDEVVCGPNGTRVALAAGSQVMLPSFSLHRSRALWGDDCDEFNPDRHFTETELFHSFSGTVSERYAPFTFPPRACLGMNFAQLESRIILAHMFRHYTFELAEPTLSLVRQRDGPFWGENYGTMAPRGGLHCIVRPRVLPGAPAAAKL